MRRAALLVGSWLGLFVPSLLVERMPVGAVIALWCWVALLLMGPAAEAVAMRDLSASERVRRAVRTSLIGWAGFLALFVASVLARRPATPERPTSYEGDGIAALLLSWALVALPVSAAFCAFLFERVRRRWVRRASVGA